MEIPIVEQIQELVKKEETKPLNEELARFKEAAKQFELLLSSGLLQKRGYTLMSIEDMYRQPPEKFYAATKFQVI